MRVSIAAFVCFVLIAWSGAASADAKEMAGWNCHGDEVADEEVIQRAGRALKYEEGEPSYAHVFCPIVRDALDSVDGITVTIRFREAPEGTSCGVSSLTKYGDPIDAVQASPEVGSRVSLKLELESNPEKAFFILACRLPPGAKLASYRYSE